MTGRSSSTRTKVAPAIRRGLRWLPLMALATWTLAPVIVSISVSLRQPADVFASPGLIPPSISLDAYGRVLSRPGFRTAFANSVVVGSGTALLTLVLAVPAGYAFARYVFRARFLLLLLVLLPALVPTLGLMTPLYRLAVAAGALDSRLTLVTVYTGVALPLAVWLLAGFFRKIPREIEDAASVDGANWWQRLRLIVFPLSLPAFIAVGVIAFREAWNEFTLVLVLTRSPEMRTLPYELFRLRASEGLPDYPAENAFALLTVAPLILLYYWVERHVVSGMTAGAVK